MRNQVAKIVLINSRREMLFYLRDNKPNLPYANYWDLIGGKVEDGETSLQAIIREISEEIDCEIKNITLEKRIFIPPNSLYKQKEMELILFQGKIDIPLKNLHLTEGKRLGYFTLKEFIKLRTPYFYKDFIVKNKSRLFCLNPLF